MTNRTKQFFILCPSFHGSSILCLLLNNHDKIRAIADANPDGGKNYDCICGKPFHECEFWTHLCKAVGRDSKSGKVFDPMPRYLPSQSLNAKIVHFINHLAFFFGPGVWKGRAAKKFKQDYQSFVKGIYDFDPFEILVDAQKNLLTTSSWASMGGQVDGIIHLMRDPRAYVASALKAHKSKDVDFYAQRWLREHRKIDYYLNFMKVRSQVMRYEDFTDDPTDALDNIFAFLGTETQDVMHKPEHGRKFHMYGNNSIREFDGKVYQNEKWRESLPAAVQQRILDLTSPLSVQYGYTPVESKET